MTNQEIGTIVIAIILGLSTTYITAIAGRKKREKQKKLILDPTVPADKIVLCNELLQDVENTLFLSNIETTHLKEVVAAVKELKNIAVAEIEFNERQATDNGRCSKCNFYFTK